MLESDHWNHEFASARDFPTLVEVPAAMEQFGKLGTGAGLIRFCARLFIGSGKMDFYLCGGSGSVIF
jgi:hypothetical protein